MKRTILFALIASVVSLNVYADWDPEMEARDAARRKAEQQRAAKQKAENEKALREARQKAMRQYLGKDANGKSDADVERIYSQRQAAAVKQAANVDAALKASASQPGRRGNASEFEQGDAAMKAMYGKSVGDIANMSEKEREAFVRNMEKQYGK